MVEIHGVVAPGFERVSDAFQQNFEDQVEVGAACSVYAEGRKVVDLWAGTADLATGRPWDEDTTVLVFSTTKGATAACAHLLAQRGELDLDAPVATYWPEFAQAGKARIPVRWLLSHQAGLPYVDPPLTLEEALAWEPMVQALEAQAPIWEPGTLHGYHGCTYGWLVGEVVRRITGRSLGTYFAEEVARPLGLDFWIGLPDEQQERVARLVGSPIPSRPEEPGAAAVYDQYLGADTMFGRTLMNAPGGTFGDRGVWDRPEVRRAEIPAGNGVGDARSIARMYAAFIGTVDGGPSAPLLTEEQVTVARTCQVDGPDQVVSVQTRIALGFWLPCAAVPFTGPTSFGHTGAGGSVGFADPEHGLGFGYVMNNLLAGDPRASRLAAATYESVGAQTEGPS